ncbi:carcinoembryonic antigen-related cell adhesion molecule 4-like [Callorhinchus milii]|uniref:carcinoembryonic antigen-related cell adhesion molecule 4-like n=1 Tax=Callorhinchus milii TaxID=7868 RepID=UPI001C3FBF03|nr:carcinoembryonic antigen-related cell adhesion molecule 4-like [Callorhinchus milii]
MQTARLGVVALCCCVCVVTAQFTITVPDNPITAAAGGTAVFTVKPSGEVRSGSWRFGTETVLLWIGDIVSVNTHYEGRAEVSLPDVSLRLKSVTVTDSGNYTVNLTPVSGDSKSATVTLKVKAKGGPPNSLSGGAIAGIVIACIVGVALITALVVWVVKVKGRAKSGSHHQNGVTMAATGNTPHQSNSGANTATARIGPQSSEYSNLTVTAPNVYENINNVRRAKNKVSKTIVGERGVL